jgi:hypothetical protein
MNGSVQAEYACEQRLSVEMLTQRSALGLGSGYQLFPHCAISINRWRGVDELSYFNDGSTDQPYFFFAVRVSG